jgi:RNA polymerase sigma factor (sigma-70 family)
VGPSAMSNHWFGTSRELRASSRPSESEASGDPRFRKEEAFWRSWLSTGARRVPIDRRRARGAEGHLKKILVGDPSGAVDFSSAMARQAVDEALHELPPQHNQVVKLAFFAGLTNREIADELGLNVSEVRRVLRSSLASVGAHLERGRAKGRRAIQDLAMLPLWKIGHTAQRTPWPSLDHVLQTGVVAVMTAVAAALLVTHQAPVHVSHAHKPAHAAVVGSAASNVIQAHKATLVEDMHPKPQAAPVTKTNRRPAPVAALPAKVAVRLPVAVAIPSLVSKPRTSVLLQLPFGA